MEMAVCVSSQDDGLRRAYRSVAASAQTHALSIIHTRSTGTVTLSVRNSLTREKNVSTTYRSADCFLASMISNVLVYDLMREPEVRPLVGHRVPFAFGGELDLVHGSPVLQRVHLAQLRYKGSSAMWQMRVGSVVDRPLDMAWL